jgi:hypothetical protein
VKRLAETADAVHGAVYDYDALGGSFDGGDRRFAVGEDGYGAGAEDAGEDEARPARQAQAQIGSLRRGDVRFAGR